MGFLRIAIHGATLSALTIGLSGCDTQQFQGAASLNGGAVDVAISAPMSLEGETHAREQRVNSAGVRSAEFDYPDPVLVYEPSSVSSIVMLLHGASQRGDTVMDPETPMGVWQDLADAHGILLIAPNGSTRLSLPSNNRFWNDCQTAGRLYSPDRDDVRLLARLIGQVGSEFGVPVEKRFVHGVSNGGAMALRLAREAGDEVAAVVSVLGLDPARDADECGEPTGVTPVLMVHGTQDRFTRYEPHRGLFGDSHLGAVNAWEQWRARNGVSQNPVTEQRFIDPESSSGAVDCTFAGEGSNRTGLCTMHGAGHLDPSIRRPYGQLAQLAFGTQNRTVESAEVAWDFFRSVEAAPSPPDAP